jgi:hypothetical protein
MAIAFVMLLIGGILFTGYSLHADIRGANVETTTWLPFFFLALALFIALGFEFVNGFHDTANAVATVIYTNSLAPLPAVIWSGCWNFVGVLVSSGAVAFGIISLLPVELILQVGSGAGFAMVFALLIAAIIWNLGTWYLGLPASSSHTLIGSIIGVGLANELIGKEGATITFRPPYGKKLFVLPYYLSTTGRTTVMWDVEPDSDIAATAGEIARRAVAETQPGSIILLHVMYPERVESLKAVTKIINDLKDKGYEFVTVSDLLATDQQ